MTARLPFCVELSHLLIAFTIEHDNEWELRYWLSAEPQPFRASLVMWANLLRFVGKDGITVEDLSRKAGYPPGKVHPDLSGMIRWAYVTIDGKDPKKPKLEDRVTVTERGSKSALAWKPLVDEIENRWQDRFGQRSIQNLKQVLVSILKTFNRPLPHYFPVLNHLKGMEILDTHQPVSDPVETLALPYLLSQVQHAFTLDVERRSDISLAIRANVIRVLEKDPIAQKDLPQLSGISKEAISMSLTWLKKNQLALEEPNLAGRGKVVRLTENGDFEKHQLESIIQAVEDAWDNTLPAETLSNLRDALAPFGTPKLFQYLDASPDLWRAKGRKRTVLPYQPMVLYRGGWPDGS